MTDTLFSLAKDLPNDETSQNAKLLRFCPFLRWETDQKLNSRFIVKRLFGGFFHFRTWGHQWGIDL